MGRVNNISSAENIAITPPNLLGIDRKIAYAQRKYHSGLIWIGVTKGLAGIKFSGSVNMLGVKNAMKSKMTLNIKNPTKSLKE